MAELTKQRPKFLNLFAIRLPLAGYASIFHRVSGIGLFLMLPLLIWLFDKSLSTPDAYAQFKAVFDCWLSLSSSAAFWLSSLISFSSLVVRLHAVARVKVATERAVAVKRPNRAW